MRAVSFSLLIAFLAFAMGCGSKPDATGGDKGGPSGGPADDKSALQGSWKVIKLDMGDETDEFSKKIAEDIKTATFTVKGDIVTANDPKGKEGPAHLRMTLDPGKSPKQIDFLPVDEKGVPKPNKLQSVDSAGKVISKDVPPEPTLCIYKLEGDTLVVAVPVGFGLGKSARPAEFKARVPKDKRKGEGDKESMIVLFHLKKQ